MSSSQDIAVPAFDKLPMELLGTIASLCDYPRDLAAWARTSRRWNTIVGHILYETSAASFWKYFSIVFWAAEQGRTNTLRHLASIRASDGSIRVSFDFYWSIPVTDIRRSPQRQAFIYPVEGKGLQTYPEHWTPLHVAAHCGHRDTVRFLLDQGVDIDASIDAYFLGLRFSPAFSWKGYCGRGDSACAPLHLAIVAGHVDTVRFLLQRGADICVKAHDDPRPPLTALHLAAMHGLPSIVKILGARPDVNVDEPDNDGFPPLLYAAERETDYSCMEALKELGANLNFVVEGANGYKQSLLVFLIQWRKWKAAAKLIELGASLDPVEGQPTIYDAFHKWKFFKHRPQDDETSGWNDLVRQLKFNPTKDLSKRSGADSKEAASWRAWILGNWKE